MPRLVKKYFKARELREKGYSLKEIAGKLSISKSTASIWLLDMKLSKQALKRLEDRQLMGRIKASETKRKKRQKEEERYLLKAGNLLNTTKINKRHLKIFCALIFECEGWKDIRSGIQFINSNPQMIATFLHLFRETFDLDESKFRVSLHVHEYHDIEKQKVFWSNITNIPIIQFQKPYLKPNTGKNFREGYPGCVNIRYYDVKVGRELQAVSKSLLKKYGN